MLTSLLILPKTISIDVKEKEFKGWFLVDSYRNEYHSSVEQPSSQLKSVMHLVWPLLCGVLFCFLCLQYWKQRLQGTFNVTKIYLKRKQIGPCGNDAFFLEADHAAHH